MDAIKSIPNNAEVDQQSIEVPFRTICSVTEIPFGGAIMVHMQPDKLCMEYCSVEIFVGGFELLHCTHEEVARYTFDAFAELEPWFLHVAVRADSPVHPTAEVIIERSFDYVELGSSSDGLLTHSTKEKMPFNQLEADRRARRFGRKVPAEMQALTHKEGMQAYAAGLD